MWRQERAQGDSWEATVLVDLRADGSLHRGVAVVMGGGLEMDHRRW